MHNKNLLLVGHRQPNSNNLWMLHHPNDNKNIPQAMQAINASAKPDDLVRFAHAALYSPAIKTLKEAIRKRYIHGFPGLSLESINKYPPLSKATVKGHLDRVRKNRKSTKRTQQEPPKDVADPTDVHELDKDVTFPEGLSDTNTPDACYVATIQTNDRTKDRAYSDQTGKFPVPSTSGNTQIFVLYHFDANYIFLEPMKNKTKESILAAYKRVYKRIKNAGLQIRL